MDLNTLTATLSLFNDSSHGASLFVAEASTYDYDVTLTDRLTVSSQIQRLATQTGMIGRRKDVGGVTILDRLSVIGLIDRLD